LIILLDFKEKRKMGKVQKLMKKLKKLIEEEKEGKCPK
jgi:hypothetical protein